MSTLRERLNRLREVFIAQVPAEIKAVMSGAELRQHARALKEQGLL